MKSLKSFVFGEKAVPYIDVISEETREGLHKAYIPKFLYKPPYGYPRHENVEYIRYLARTPYVQMCISTILKEIASIEWDISVNPDIPKDIAEKEFYNSVGEYNPTTQAEINHIRSFLDNPNTNNESFQDIFIEMALRDVLEINTGVVNKVFNMKKNMVELVARDGGSFTKNPDVHGMFTDRADIMLSKTIVQSPSEAINSFRFIDDATVRQQAAYFQYGWIAGPVPIPFGRREIIWFQDRKHSYDIYGYSPVQLLAKTLQMLVYHVESDLEYFNKNNVPKGIIGIEASDADEIKSFKEQWWSQQTTRDEFGSTKKNMHQIPILNYLPKFERIEFSSAEIQLIEKQKWYSKMVWSCFGCTPAELGYTEDGQGISNQIVQSKVFKKKAINPLLRMLERAVNKEVLNEFEYSIDAPIGNGTIPMPKYIFKFNTFDIDEEKNKAELHKMWLEMGRKTINEIRVSEGENPVEWGDDDPRNIGGGGMNDFGGFGGDNYGDMEDNAQDTDVDTNTPNTNDTNDTNDKMSKQVDNKKSFEKSKLKDPENELMLELSNLLDATEEEVLKYIEKETL